MLQHIPVLTRRYLANIVFVGKYFNWKWFSKVVAIISENEKKKDCANCYLNSPVFFFEMCLPNGLQTCRKQNLGVPNAPYVYSTTD